MAIELDHLDKLAASVFDGYLVRKGSVRGSTRASIQCRPTWWSSS